MPLPMMTVSGIRGVVNETIDELFITKIAYTQTKLANGRTMVIGRDTRPSGEAFAKAAFRGIRAAGGIPIDLGVAPTPTTCLATANLQADGGIILTASHNPTPYNGYKMIHSSGRLYRASECESVYQAFHRGDFPSNEELAAVADSAEKTVDAAKLHIERILNTVDVKKIRGADISIAVDSINGAAGAVFPGLLEALNVSWKGVHNKLDGNFVHNPEPRPEHLTDLAALLKEMPGSWGGFVFDPDADRLATMGENGEPVSEEMTLAFSLMNLLSRKKSDVVTNLSTSMVIDDVAESFGVKVIRSKIGEANVVEAMEKSNSTMGGEGNGGVIFPEIVRARDGLTGMALILELMADSNKRITELAAQWPHYTIVKEKINCEGLDPNVLITALEEKFSAEECDTTDGLKILREYGWVHLRPSNTEPIIRCYAEAGSEIQANELATMVLEEAKRIT